MVAPFDSRALALTGAAVPLVEGIRRIGTDPAGVGLTQMSFSSSGTLTYIPGPTLVTADGKASLALFDQKGTITELKLPQGIYREPRMSPDGKAVAFETDDGNEASIWIYQLDGLTDRRRLTFGGNNRHPLWSADGQWVLFQSNREGDASLFRQRADGAGVAERVTRASGGSEHVPQSSSPDGRHLVYSEQSSKGSKLFVMTLEDRKVVGLAGTESVDINGEGALSPDGRWLAYQKKDTPEGQRQVMLQPFPPTGARYLVRDGIAGHPFWTPKGDALMLNVSPISSERVPFISKPGPQFGRPEPFSRTGRIEPNPSNTRRNVDAIPGSDRVIGVRIPGGSVTATSVGMVVVLNWFEEIRQRTSAR
jgi:Tol biopolymer transport system component